ncbi:hypothetical protein KQI65_00605 [bacterium]|nr:hypothetical protein [bacterium]
MRQSPIASGTQESRPAEWGGRESPSGTQDLKQNPGASASGFFMRGIANGVAAPAFHNRWL